MPHSSAPWSAFPVGRLSSYSDDEPNGDAVSTPAAGHRSSLTRKAMQAELSNIERLTLRVILVLGLAIAGYAGGPAWFGFPHASGVATLSRGTPILAEPGPATAEAGAPSPPQASAGGRPQSKPGEGSAVETSMSGERAVSARSRAFSEADGLANLLSTISLYGAVLICTAVSGGFLGFLFGIPRQTFKPTPIGVAAATANEPKGRAGHFEGNTNLEEISDWLTKIIVGLGLTQARVLYDAFRNAKTAFVAHSMADAPGADSMFTAIFLSGLVLGFLCLYMETRTRIALLLVTSDHVQNSYAPAKLLRVVTRKVDPERALNAVRITSVRSPSQQTSPSEEDFKIASLPIEAPRDTNELITWVLAQVSTRNFAQAEKALKRAVERYPDRPEFYTSLAAVRNWAGQTKAANATLDQAAQRFPDNTRVWKDKLLASLYLKPPRSFEDALAAADELKARDPTASNDPFVWFWIACAYGQKVSFLADGEEKTAARMSALTAVRAVIANSQEGSLVRRQLRKVYDPAIENSDPLENDLEVFHGDPAFVAEIAKAV